MNLPNLLSVFLTTLGLKTVILSVAVVFVALILRQFRCRSALFRRTLWLSVLLLGAFGAGFPVSFAVYKTIPIANENQIENPNENPIENRPDMVDDFLRKSPLPNTPDFLDGNREFSESIPAADQTALTPSSDLNIEHSENPTSGINATELQEPKKTEIAIVPVVNEITYEITNKPESDNVGFSFLIYAVFGLWLFGMIATLGYWTILYALLLRKTRNLEKVCEKHGEFAAQWNSLLAEYGISQKRLPLLFSDSLGPGLIRTLNGFQVVVPRDLWEELSEEIRHGILQHELAHYRNGDVWWSGLARLLVLPHWFNPASWFVLRKIDETAEWMCDAAAYGNTSDGTFRFAESLIAVHESSQALFANRYAFGGANQNQGQSMDRRVRELQLFINKQKDSLMKKTFLTLLFGTLFIATVFPIRFVPVTIYETNVLQSKAVETSMEEPKVAEEPKAAEEQKSTEEPPGIHVELTDMQGKAASSGYVRTYPRPRPADWEGDQPRNFPLEQGKCFVPLSNFDQLKSFKMVLYADGFAPYEDSWSGLQEKKNDQLPKHYTRKLETAADPIGGIVVNESGKPVEGAEFTFSVSLAGRQKDPDVVTNYGQWIKTDAQGRWNYKVLPEWQLEENFDLTINHPDYPRFRIFEGQTFKDFAQKDAQGNFSKTITLPSGVTLRGKTVDENGNPVKDVLVYSNAAKRDSGWVFYGSTRTDENGEFLFENCSPQGDLGKVDVGVCPKDFAPDITTLEKITPDTEPLIFVLKPGKKLTIRAVDDQGNPVEGLSLNTRGGARFDYILFENEDEYHQVPFGENGVFVWNNAPEDKIDFTIQGNNQFQNFAIDYKTLKFGEEENVFVLHPILDIIGNVTDAETGEPIPSFTISEWFSFKISSGGLTREFGSRSGKDGKFTGKYGRRMGETDHYHIRIEADGYAGMLSEDFFTLQNKRLQEKKDLKEPYTLDFPLKKADVFSNTIFGTVLLPNGQPAAGAEIGIATAAYGIQTKGSYLNHPGMGQLNRTDAQGKFALSKDESRIGDQDYKFLFLHDGGSLLIGKEEFEKRNPDEPLQLQAWGRLEGIVKIGNKPAKNVPLYYSRFSIQESYESVANRDKARISFYNDDNLKTDENGKYVVNRVFPGTGRIGRSLKYNDFKVTAPYLVQDFKVEPGETVRIDFGGGGYSVKGRITLSPETPSPVDWRFAHVEATPVVPDNIAFPALSKEEEEFQRKMAASFIKFTSNVYRGADTQMEDFKRWEESPEGKELIASHSKAYEKVKKQIILGSQYEKDREKARLHRIVCAVNEKGEFQLDDLTPGNWTLEVEVNFPKVPLQWWDFEDRWKRKETIMIPEQAKDWPDEPLEIRTIFLGYDPSDRRGPER